MAASTRRIRAYKGKTKAYRRFDDSLWRSSRMLEASVLGLDEKQKSFGDIVAKFDSVKQIPGPFPKNYEPSVSASKLDDGNINVTFDERSAALMKRSLLLVRSKHRYLKFHLYSILAVSIWGAFETYVVMLLEELFQKRPEMLKSAETVT